ncbi:MAG: hypothetical protein CSB13_09495 [Chloroflexi bacterium]|nr:MAG: hypothetical protein CSB13_09495 [Chloroflexota bacterium]
MILLDEPSSNLDEEKTKLIGEILKKLKALGKTIIISEHRFYYIKEIIDRVYYIDDGIIINEFSTEAFFSIDNESRKNLGLRSIDFEELNYKETAESKANKQLVINHINYAFKGGGHALKMHDITFNFGTIIGVYGHNGVGKSTFLKLLMGLEKSRDSKILLNNKELSSKKRVKRSYLVMQDVNHQLFTDSVETEVTLGKADKYSDKDVKDVLKTLNIYDVKARHPMSLSGGQKQRVAIASAILSGAEILCFDEPTSGMDYDNMMRISRLIKDTLSDEIIIFVISHDHEFLNNTVDQVLNMVNFSTERSGSR